MSHKDKDSYFEKPKGVFETLAEAYIETAKTDARLRHERKREELALKFAVALVQARDGKYCPSIKVGTNAAVKRTA